MAVAFGCGLALHAAAEAGANATSLTADDLAWVQAHPVVRYSGEPSWAPLEFVEDGRYSGIASGYLKLLGSATGLQFEYVPAKDWDEAVGLMKAGKLDLFPCIGDTAERHAYLLFTQPYLSFPLVIVTRKDAAFVGGMGDLAGRSVSVPEGFYTHERLRAEHPEIKLVVRKGEADSLRAVSIGEADAFIGNVAVCSYYIDKLGLANLKVAAPTDYQNSELCMAVRADLLPLQRILQKALAALPPKSADDVRQAWIGVRYEYGLDPRIVWRSIVLTLVVAGPLGLAILYYTRRLQKQVEWRRAAEARLEQKKRVLEATLTHMAQGILMADANGCVLAYNQAYQQFFGYSDAFLEARPNVADIFRDYWRARGFDDDAIEESIADTKRREPFEYEMMLSDGRIVNVMHTPMPDGGMVRTYTDITQRKRHEEETRHLAEAAEAASRAKGAFLANMSHEIRTPLNAIIGFGQLLGLAEDIAPRHREHIEIMLRSGEHLLGLINDVLDMSKIEAGRTELSIGTFELPTLLRDVFNMFRLRVQEKGLACEVELDAGLPLLVRGDEGKLRQIVINLLGNAVKFTERGGIVLRAWPEPGGEEGTLVHVEVRDTGAGIASEELGLLFQAFSQTSAGVRSRGGTGLGLAISREFARMMGGDIAVESRLGEGSIFRLTIKVACVRTAADVLSAEGMTPSPLNGSATDATPCLAHLRLDIRRGIAFAAACADPLALQMLAAEAEQLDSAAAEFIRAALADFRYEELAAAVALEYYTP